MSDFLTAALMHDVAPMTNETSGGNWLDSLASLPGTIGQGIVSSVTEVLNIPTALASIPINLLGGDYDGKWLRTEDVFAELDNALGTDMEQYYYKHQESVDTFGFVGSSLVPGLAGAKALRVGLGGVARLENSSGMLRAIGQFENYGPKAIQSAKMEIADNLSPFTYMNKEAFRVYAAGAGQGVLDALAYNTAATIALHQSSYLESKDWKELGYDILFDSIVFGAPAGAIFDVAGKGVGILGYKKAIRGYADEFADVKATALSPFKREGDIVTKGTKVVGDTGTMQTIAAGDEALQKVYQVKQFEDHVTDLERLRNEGALSTDNAALLDAEIRSFTRLRNEAVETAKMEVTNSVKKAFKDVEDIVDVQGIAKQLIDPNSPLDKSASVMAGMKAARRLDPDQLAGNDYANTLRVYSKGPKEKVQFSLDEIPGGESRMLKLRNPLNTSSESEMLAHLGLANKTTKVTVNEIEDAAFAAGYDSLIVGNRVQVLKKFNKKGILQSPAQVRSALIDIRDGKTVNKAARATAWDMRVSDYKNTLNNLISDEADDVLELSGKLTPLENSTIYRKAIEDFNKGKLKEATNLAELDVLVDKLADGGTIKFNGRELSKSQAVDAMVDRKAALIDELSEQGYSTEQISAALFIPEETIYNRLAETGFSNVGDTSLHAPRYIQAVYDRSRNINKFELEGKLEVAKKTKLVQMQADAILGAAAPELASVPKIVLDKYSENFLAGVFSFADAKFSSVFEQSVLAASKIYSKITQKAIEARVTPLKSKLEAIKAAGVGSADHSELVLLNSWNKRAKNFGNGNTIAIETPNGITLMQADEFNTFKRGMLEEIAAAGGDIANVTGADVLAGYIRSNPEVLNLKTGEAKSLFRIQTASVNDFIKSHIQANQKTLKVKNQLNSIHGQTLIKTEQLDGAFTFYDPNINLRNAQHILVIQGSKNSSNPLYAGQQYVFAGKSLDEIRAAQSWAAKEGLQAYTKNETRDFYKMVEAYENNLTFNNGAIKEALQSKGKLTSYTGAAESFEDTATRYLDWHLRDESAIQRQLIALKEHETISTLKQIDLHEKRLVESRKGNPSRIAKLLQGEDTKVTKPEQIMNTIFNTQNPGVVNAITKAADDFGIQFATGVRNFLAGVKSTDLDDVNSLASKKFAEFMKDRNVEEFITKDIVQSMGVKNYDSPGYANFIRASNMALVMGQLRLDAINSLVNVIGMPIIGSGTVELAIRSTIANLAKAGREADIVNLKKALYHKEGRLGYMPSTYVRMAKQSIGRLESKAKDNKIIGSLAQGDETLAQFYLRNNITYNPAEVAAMDLTEATLQSLKAGDTKASNYMEKIKKYASMLTKPADAIESRIQFVSADAGMQIAEAANLSADEAILMMHTMVNKLQGNFSASMKPQIFQGITGSALGLFQSYQARLVHRLSDMITDGNKRMVFEAGVLQASIFGGRSLPFFDALNASLVAQSNEDNQDIYSTVYGGVDRNIANSMVYGLPSALLGLNMSTRGMATPRFPSTITDIPAVNIWYKLAAQMKDTLQQAGNGADMSQLFNHAMQHNVFNRPMQQLGVLLAGYSTTSNNKLGVDINDAKLFNENNWLPFNVSNYMRISGSRPLDEQVLLDTVYRWQGYELADREKKEQLGRAVSSQLLANGELSPDKVNQFTEDYMKAGGTSKGFGMFIKNQAANTSLSASDRLLKQIKNEDKSKHLQYMLGKPPEPNQIPSLEDIMPTDEMENYQR